MKKLLKQNFIFTAVIELFVFHQIGGNMEEMIFIVRVDLFIYLFIYSFTCLFVYIYVYLITYLFVYLFIYLFIYCFIVKTSCISERSFRSKFNFSFNDWPKNFSYLFILFIRNSVHLNLNAVPRKLKRKRKTHTQK